MKLLYIVFFGLLDLTIISIITRSFKLNRYFLVFSVIFTTVLFILQVSSLLDDYLMPSENFINILFLSYGMIVLHYIAKMLLYIFPGIQPKEINQNFLNSYMKFANFFFGKFMYGFIYLAQVLDIYYTDFDKL